MDTFLTRFILFVKLLYAVSCFGQTPGWAGTEQIHDSTQYVSTGTEIVTDNLGNTITGFDINGPCFIGEHYTAPLTGTWSSSYVWKQDPDGKTLWVKQLAASRVLVDDLGTDADGNIYVLAKYFNPIDLEGYSFAPIDWADYIIAKLNPAGDYLWITNVGYVYGLYDFCVGQDGSCFITGSLDWGSNYIGPFYLSDVSYSDMFVAKLDSSGTWQWAKRASGNGCVDGNIIIANNAGGCILIGHTTNDVNIGSIYLPGNGFDFVASYLSNGNPAWAHICESGSVPRAIVQDGLGNVYLLNNYSYSLQNMKIFKLNGESEPTLVFSLPFACTINGLGIAIDSSRNFYLMGTHTGPFSIEGVNFSGQQTVFFLKLNENFNVVWGSSQITAFSWIAVTHDGLLRGTRRSYDTQPIGDFYTFPRTHLGYVAGMDSEGEIVWLRSTWDERIGSKGVDLCFDSLGSRYVCGTYEGAFLSHGTLCLNKGETGNDIYISKTDNTGNWQWISCAGGAENDEVAAIIADSNQNTYLTGSFMGTIHFGDLTLESQGAEDIFLAKLDTSGNWLWAYGYGGEGSDRGLALTLDQNGDVLLTGCFSESGLFGQNTLVSAGGTDLIVMKLTEDGIIQSLAQGGGSGDDSATGIAVLPSGQIALCGDFWTTADFGDFELVSLGEQDFFIARMNGNLNWLNAVSAGANNVESVTSIAVDPLGNRYVTGYFFGTTSIGGFALQSHGDSDIFVAKLDNEDNWIWALSGGSEAADKALSLAVSQTGRTFLTGFSSGAVTMGNIQVQSYNGMNILCAAVHENGNWYWVKHSGSNTNNPLYWDAWGSGIALNNAGNCVVTGKFSGSTHFGGGEYNSNGYYDTFISTLMQGTEAEDVDTVPAAEMWLSIYPNPFTNQISIQLNSKNKGLMNADIFNLKGQKVKSYTGIRENSFVWDGRDECDKQVSSGVYFIRISQGTSIISKKVLKVK